MSNAMRMGKRTLAGVAAGALGLALIPFVATTSAQAATTTGSVSPVRYVPAATDDTVVNTNVPSAYVSWPKAAAPSLGNGSFTIQLEGTNSAGGTGQLQVDDSTGGTAVTENLITTGTPGTDDETTVVGTNIPVVLGDGASDAYMSKDDSFIRIRPGGQGLYQGLIFNGEDTVSFSFTTAGAINSIELTPATQNVLVGGTAQVTATIKDAAGNLTQMSAANEGFSTEVTGAGGTVSATVLTSSTLVVGQFPFDVEGMASGTSTVTSRGTNALVGLTASATVTASGTVSDDTVQNMAIECTSGCWNATTTSKVGPWDAQIKNGVFTTLKVNIDDTTLNTAGDPLRFKVTTGAGTVTVDGDVATASEAAYVQVTPTSGKATFDLLLGGGAGFVGNSGIVVQQVNVADADLGATSNLTIVPVNPADQLDVTMAPTGNAVAKIGDPTTLSISIDDSFGEAVASQFVGAYLGSTINASTLLTNGVTDSNGQLDLSVSCSTCTTNNSTQLFSISTNGTSAADSVTVTYTTDGTVSTLSVKPFTGSENNAAGTATVTTYPVISVPNTTGVVDAAESTGVYTVATAKIDPAASSSMMSFVATTTPGNGVTVTAPEGVKLSTTAPTGTNLIWSSGSQTATIQGSGDDSVFVWATKTGTHDITFESGGKSVTMKLVVTNASDDAYNIDLTPASQAVGSGAIGTVTLKVTDVFGNPVQTGTADDSGNVTISASGEVLLAGFLASRNYQTNASGEVTVTFIAGNAAGTGTLAATPTSTSTTPAWVSTFTPPAGAPAPVVSAAATVTVSSSPEAQTIDIIGSRGIVRGKPGIIVDGLTTGFDEGAILRPWVKFPGETQYAEGVRQIPVDQDGEFIWQRRTGKKIYIIIKSEDGTVRSNRIIIQAK